MPVRSDDAQLPLARGLVLTAPGSPTRDDWILAGLANAGPAAAVSWWGVVRIHGLGASELTLTAVSYRC
jgi:hypothetical protein